MVIIQDARSVRFMCNGCYICIPSHLRQRNPVLRSDVAIVSYDTDFPDIFVIKIEHVNPTVKKFVTDFRINVTDNIEEIKELRKEKEENEKLENKKQAPSGNISDDTSIDDIPFTDY